MINEVLKRGLCAVLNDRDAAFGTVPKGFVDLEVILLLVLQVGPNCEPFLQNASCLAIGKRHFLDAVNFKRRSVQHLLDSARLGVVHAECDHLIDSEWHLLLKVLVESVEARRLRKE